VRTTQEWVNHSVASEDWIHVKPQWDDVHELPHPVLLDRKALAVVTPMAILYEAGQAFWGAHEEERATVGFEVPLARSRRKSATGAVIVTTEHPGEGLCHRIFLGHEERPNR
jgi:hypothetical protein